LQGGRAGQSAIDLSGHRRRRSIRETDSILRWIIGMWKKVDEKEEEDRKRD
jgi:hypothetical protein